MNPLDILLWIALVGVIVGTCLLIIWCIVYNYQTKREEKRKRDIADEAIKQALRDKEKEKQDEKDR